MKVIGIQAKAPSNEINFDNINYENINCENSIKVKLKFYKNNKD